jgi:RNA polymerase sigma-70 factor (ECF subfamily)
LSPRLEGIRHDEIAPLAHPVRPVAAAVESGSQPSDAALIQAARAEPERFADLYDRHAADLYRYTRRRVGPDLAEDIVADVFVTAFRRLDSYDVDRPDARPWLFGILTKEISRHHRRERARFRALARAPQDRPHDSVADRVADTVSAAAVARRALAGAIAGLAVRDRDVLLLVAWGGLNYFEVAQTLGIPVGTVRSRLSRARRVVRAALGASEEDL